MRADLPPMLRRCGVKVNAARRCAGAHFMGYWRKEETRMTEKRGDDPFPLGEGHADLMAALGRGGRGPIRVPDLSAPPVFDAARMRLARDLTGANCGPGALAAALGEDPADVARRIPRFLEKGYTTEVMMARCLAGYGVRFEWDWVMGAAPTPWPDRALVRMCFGGGDLMGRLRRSHWVLTRPGPDGQEVFDVNALGEGGWVPKRGWDDSLAPWIGDVIYDGTRGWADVERIRLIDA